MKRYLLSILLFSCFASWAQQKRNNIWTFGIHAGVDFNSGSPVAIIDSINAREGCASICDGSGQILFYTNGSEVYDRNNNIMLNGDNLTGLPIAVGTGDPTESTTQGSLIVPIPDSANKYYVFSLTSLEQGFYFGMLYYSVVNMDLNGGLGDIEFNRKGIKIDSGLSEKMIAVVGDKCNIWLLLHNTNRVRASPPEFRAYEITNAGISTTPVISQSGTYEIRLNYSLGVLKASPDRRKLVTCNTMGGQGAELYDFDPATGIVSNNILLDAQHYYGACFSPDNSKLYISATDVNKIYQYDISSGIASTIRNSRIEVTDSSNNVGTDLKLAPDGKIYFIPSFSTHYLSAINYPNLSGLACQVVLRALPLLPTTETVYGLPNVNPLLLRDTVTPVNQNVTVCFLDSTILYANDSGWDYTWSDNTHETYRTVYTSGIYTVSYFTAPCTYHADTFKVNFSSHLPKTGFFSGCGDSRFTFLWIQPNAIDTGVYSYIWADTAGNVLQQHTKKNGDTLYGLQPGIYFVNMKTADGCDTTFKLEMTGTPYQTTFTADTLVCLGDSVHFTNTSQGSISYTWYFDDGDSSIENDLTHLYTTPGAHKAILVSYPCLDTTTKVIVVDSTPYVYFTTDSIPVCIGKANYFYPVYQSNAVSLSWNFGDGSVATNDWRPTHGYSAAGTVVVTVTAKFRVCADTLFKDTITVYDYPVVDLGPDTSICDGQSAIHLTNLFNSNAAGYYLWSTGATTSTIDIKEPGRYWLTVAGEHGCATTDSVLVNNDCYIAIPNAFTPNGDGVNDYFFPREILTRGVTTFHMQIYNAWGVMVFETNETGSRGWDGLFNGTQQTAGVYVYLIEASFKNGIQQQYKGNITLIR